MTLTKSYFKIIWNYQISDCNIVRVFESNVIDLSFKFTILIIAFSIECIEIIRCTSFKVLGLIIRLSKDFIMERSLKSLHSALVHLIPQ